MLRIICEIILDHFCRCYSTETDISFEMLAIKEVYRYEYLGDCTQPVMYKSMERTIYNFISSYAMKVTRYFVLGLTWQLERDI